MSDAIVLLPILAIISVLTLGLKLEYRRGKLAIGFIKWVNVQDTLRHRQIIHFDPEIIDENLLSRIVFHAV
jgi:hypothetical protein